MKLTKKQKVTMKEHGWDIITNHIDGEEQNCGWLALTPEEDGHVYHEVVEHFGLTGDGEDVKLLVIGTSEE